MTWLKLLSGFQWIQTSALFTLSAYVNSELNRLLFQTSPFEIIQDNLFYIYFSSLSNFKQVKYMLMLFTLKPEFKRCFDDLDSHFY